MIKRNNKSLNFIVNYSADTTVPSAEYIIKYFNMTKYELRPIFFSLRRNTTVIESDNCDFINGMDKIEMIYTLQQYECGENMEGVRPLDLRCLYLYNLTTQCVKTILKNYRLSTIGKKFDLVCRILVHEYPEIKNTIDATLNRPVAEAVGGECKGEKKEKKSIEETKNDSVDALTESLVVELTIQKNERRNRIINDRAKRKIDVAEMTIRMKNKIRELRADLVGKRIGMNNIEMWNYEVDKIVKDLNYLRDNVNKFSTIYFHMFDREKRAIEILTEMHEMIINGIRIREHSRTIDNIQSYFIWYKDCVTHDDCPVCFNTLCGDLCVPWTCNHTFHKVCMARWISTNDSCPTCRCTEVNAETAIVTVSEIATEENLINV